MRNAQTRVVDDRRDCKRKDEAPLTDVSLCHRSSQALQAECHRRGLDDSGPRAALAARLSRALNPSSVSDAGQHP